MSITSLEPISARWAAPAQLFVISVNTIVLSIHLWYNQNMKKFKWDEEKNQLLKKERGVSFEEILNSTFLGAEKHQTRKNQIVLLFEHEKYVWVVPCVVDDKFIFLKTMFPSRKYTKMLKSKEGAK